MTSVDVRVAEIAARAEAARDLLPLEAIEFDATEDALYFLVEEDVPFLLGELEDAQSEVRSLRSVVEDAERVIAEARAKLAEYGRHGGPHPIVAITNAERVLSTYQAGADHE